ncbi:MAG TPA: outer membrane protein transport protein [Kofleriaceae bacterium]
MRKLLLATLLSVPATSYAGGYIIPNANARDLALANATVAAQDGGAEALFINTAELAGDDGLDISLSGGLLLNRTSWSDPNLGSASLIPQYNTPPSLAVSFGKTFANDMAIALGVGFDIPAGGAIVWPTGWQGQEAIQSVEQKVYRTAVGIGFQPLKYVKIGASYVRYQATEELHQSLNYLDHYGDGGLAMDGGSNSFEAGLSIHVPVIPLVLAAQYSHSGDLDLKGNAHFTNVPPAFTGLIHDQGVTEALHIPNTLQLGASYAVVPNIQVMFQYSFERWSQYDKDDFVGSDGFEVVVPRRYNNAHVYRGGLEWIVSGLPELTLRFGGLRSVSSQPKDTVSPSLTDGNSIAYSIGAGFNVVPSFRVDFGYQHAWFDALHSTGTEAFPGSYATHVDMFSLGINWRTDLGLAPHTTTVAPE